MVAYFVLSPKWMALNFDRGTLISRDITELPTEARRHFTWDARVDRFRAPAAAYGLLSRRSIEQPREPIAYFPAPKAVTAPDLRPYQSAALEAWRASGESGVVVLPTGAGKTRLALAAIAVARKPTIILAPTRVLLAQWLTLARELWGDDCGALGDGEVDVRPITVATFESAYRHMDRLGNRFALLIVDEAHHFGGGERGEALAMCIATARLGLTATPPRTPEQLARLSQYIGPIVFEVQSQSLAGTFLAHHDYERLHIALSAEERETYERSMSAFRHAQRELRMRMPSLTMAGTCRVLAGTTSGRQALAGLREARRLASFTRGKAHVVASLLDTHRDARTIVFTADNTATYAIARENLIAPLTADIKRREREETLAAFHAGDIRALVSARVLNEGFDVPLAEIGIIVGASLGEREHLQRVGRLLRPAPGKRALIYELVSAATYEVARAQRRARP